MREYEDIAVTSFHRALSGFQDIKVTRHVIFLDDSIPLRVLSPTHGCDNHLTLFRLEVGESFSCDFSNEGLWELEALLHTAGELNPEADVCEPWKMGQRG